MPTSTDTVIAAARDFLGDRITTNAALREHHSHGQDTQPPVLPDAVAFVETTRGSRPAARALPRRPRAGGRLGRRHLARGPRHAGARRHHARPVAHDPHPRRSASPTWTAASRPASRATSSTRTCATRACSSRSIPAPRLHHRRHVRDPRLRHQRGALRHHPRERAGPDRGAGRRPRDPHRRPRAQIRHRLRPDPAVHRLRRHARRHHRNPAPPARHPRGDVVRHLPVPHAARRGGDGDRHPADGHSGRAHGTAGRGADGGLHRLFEAGRPASRCRPCSSNSTAPTAGVAEQAQQAEEIAAGFDGQRLPLGHRRRRAQQAMAGAARRATGPAWP